MSFDINWENLVSDESFGNGLKEFLDEQFKNLSLPSFIDHLSLTKLDLGSVAPEIIIRHIGDPFDGFYVDGDDDRDVFKAPVPSTSQEDDSDEEDILRQREHDDGDLHSIGELDSSYRDLAGTEIDSRGITTPVNSPRASARSRTSSDSISLIIGNNMNYIHNYNINPLVGLGNLNSASGRETPTIFNKNPLKQGSSSYFKSRLSTKEKSETRHENDMQAVVEINYEGDLHMEVTVNLLVNYPSPKFITLPIKLHISEIIIHSIAAIAYLKHSVFFSFLCDINDSNSDYFSSSQTHEWNPNSGGNFVDYSSAPGNRDRIDVIKKMRIESEIGEFEQNVLRNVGKVEKFLIEQLRKIIRDEIAWPSWICFELDDANEEDGFPNEELTENNNSRM